MKHSFVSGLVDKSKCSFNGCGRSLDDHTKLAQCEACPNQCECDLFGTMLLCPDCIAKELKVAVNQGLETEANNQFVMDNPKQDLIQHSANVDAALKIREDFFNAETISIVELAKECGKDNAKLFDLIKTRQVEFQKKLIEIKESELNLNSRLRAQQQYLHDLAKQLTEQERATRKIEDIKYQPVIKEVKAPKVKVTAQEKMAQNLMASKMLKAAQSLIDSGEFKDIEEAKQVAVARGMVISIEQARAEITKLIG